MLLNATERRLSVTQLYLTSLQHLRMLQGAFATSACFSMLQDVTACSEHFSALQAASGPSTLLGLPKYVCCQSDELEDVKDAEYTQGYYITLLQT